ncbi:hypothetical protein [Methylobacterium sp. SD21]|uniref:hypothetical protein n=1 Tax=Methylobacterium litchii TaxID=3138810 RepID=UPI00313CA48D
MIRTVHFLSAACALAVVALGSGSALAQNEVVDPARLTVAKRHMAQVCQPLEAAHQYTRAVRCFSNVTAYLTDRSVQLIAPTVPQRVARDVAPAPTRVAMASYRRPGGLLASNFVLLGVGY